MSTIINTLTGSRFKRCLAMVLCLCMVLSMAPVPSFAAASCEHHPVHTAECGYVEAVAGQPCLHQHDASCGYQEAAACGHVCGDGLCGYVAAQACGHYCGDGLCNYQAAVGCDHVCGEACIAAGCTHFCGDGTCSYQEGRGCDHVHGGCGYQEGRNCDHVHSAACGYREFVPCTHVNHDVSCGYVEAVAGHDCGFVCDICNGTAPQETVPQETIPEVTVPQETVPQETVPQETVPEVTTPEGTVPEETTPEGTVPEVTTPEVTTPETTVPEVTIPEETIPQETIPQETIPEESQAAECICDVKCDPAAATEGCEVCALDPSACQGEEPETQPENVIITAWSWVDEEELIDPETNELIVSFASAEQPLVFDELVAFLPYEIVAQVDGVETVLELGSWTSADYPMDTGAFQGTYLLQTTLPQGYVLAEGLAALQISVVFAHDAALNEEEHAHTYDNGICTVPGCTSPYMPAGGDSSNYQIGNAGQLFWFAEQVNVFGQGSINGELTANITMPSDRQWTPIGSIGSIGSTGAQYSGTFDGMGKTIDGLTFNNTTRANVGLFGYLNSGGTIRNVTLTNASITGKEYVGGICGVGSGIIGDCHFSGTVKATESNAGGICGKSTRNIGGCTASGSVTAESNAGGICGELFGGRIVNCLNSCAVRATWTNAGGICGIISGSGSVSGCLHTGTQGSDISGKGPFYGQLTNGTVSGCYYLADSAGTDGARTQKQLASGEVAWELNKSEGGWGQTIGTDPLPVLYGVPVFRIQCADVVRFTNDAHGDVDTDFHNFNDDGLCSNCGTQAVADVDGTKYLDIKIALKAAQEKDVATLKLLTDASLSDENSGNSWIDIYARKLTLNLNGHDLNGVSYINLGMNDSTLIIQGEGEISYIEDGQDHYPRLELNGSYNSNVQATISGGTFGNVKVSGYGANLIMDGGTVHGLQARDDATVNISGGTVNGGIELNELGYITVTGGTVNGEIRLVGTGVTEEDTTGAGTIDIRGDCTIASNIIAIYNANFEESKVIISGGIFTDPNLQISICLSTENAIVPVSIGGGSFQGLKIESSGYTLRDLWETGYNWFYWTGNNRKPFTQEEAAVSEVSGAFNLQYHDHSYGNFQWVYDDYHGKYCTVCGMLDDDSIAEHWFVEGFCTDCGAYQKPQFVDPNCCSIRNAGELFWFAEQCNKGENYWNARLVYDIRIPEGHPWTPIEVYQGNFDGNGHSISGLQCHVEGNAGLFAWIKGGSVTDFSILNSSISGANAGAICAVAEASDISKCYSEADVTGEWNVGSLVGELINSRSFAYCGADRGYLVGRMVDCRPGSCYGVEGLFREYGGNNRFENCYYQSEEATGGQEGLTPKTLAQFQSGEVTYLLNGEQRDIVWKQDLGAEDYGAEDYPSFIGLQVYPYQQPDCAGGSITCYSNDMNYEPTGVAHSFNESLVCTKCGQTIYYQADGTEASMKCTILTQEYLQEHGNSLSGNFVVVGELTAAERITVNGTVNLVLADGCRFDAEQGITVNDNNSLTIYGQKNGSGKLNAASPGVVAAIGSHLGNDCGAITINGGTVFAVGGVDAAGIGGGQNSGAGSITINGGKVTATGGQFGAGIGAGNYGRGGTIIINGGTVVARGGTSGAGIGSSKDGINCTITISGGTVTATGYNGIGVGMYGSDVTFSTGDNDNGRATIYASSINATTNQEEWSGIIYQGDEGQVYGNPNTDIVVPADKKLLIPEGTTLDASKVTNSGTVYVAGQVSGTLSGNGNVYYALRLINCTATGEGVVSAFNGTFAKPDSQVNLTPGAAPSGQTFVDWDNSDVISVENNSFIMTIYPVTIEANFADIVATVTAGGKTTNYTDIQVALDAANNATGSTLTLMTNVTTTGTLGVTGEFTLDLNGCTLENTETVGIVVEAGAELTIQDSIGEEPGTIKAPDTSTAVHNSGTLNITGGLLEGMNAVFNLSGQVSISGGHFKALPRTGSSGFCISGMNGSVTVTGGTFEFSGDFACDFFDTVPKVYGGTFVNGVKVLRGTPYDVLANGYAYFDGNNLVDGSATITKTVTVGEHRTHSFTYNYLNDNQHTATCGCGYSVTEIHVDINGTQTVCPCGYTWYSVGGNRTFINCTILTQDYLVGCNYTLPEGWYVVQGEVVITETITTTGPVILILADGCEFITSKPIQAGVLSIYGQSIYSEDSRTGKLTVNVEDEYETAISGTELSISGGVIQTTSNGTGIGSLNGWGNSDPVRITIYDGYVSTTSANGAGIGSSAFSNADVEVKILGGTVVASAKRNVAIGACMGSYGKLVLNFAGGKVHASSENESAIGRSESSGSGGATITIDATNDGEPCFSDVTAISGSRAFSHNPVLNGNFKATVADSEGELNPDDLLTHPFEQAIFMNSKAAWIRPCSSHEMGPVTRLDDEYHQTTCKWCGYQEIGEHNFNTTTGFCKICDAYQPAEEVEGYYQITNAGQLFWFANEVNVHYGSGNGKLMNNIQIPEKDGTPRQWTRICDDSMAYKGTFDGQGHTISGLYYENREAKVVGLFGRVDGGQIRNVTVDGSFVGRNNVGGICGSLVTGSISGCVNQATVTATENSAGGICGESSGGTISNCHNSGSITGGYASGFDAYAGGICGSLSSSAWIQSCSNSGTVTGKGYPVGGIAGGAAEDWSGKLTNCWNSGSIKGPFLAGGIIGRQFSDQGIVSNCYSYGTVSVEHSNCGPICSPDPKGTLSNCYYLESTGTDSIDGTTAMTESQFASGEVAYLLGSAWGQTLRGSGKQSYPVLGGARVYQSTNKCPVYYNQGEELHDYHTPGADGCCTICGTALAASVTVGNVTKGYVNFQGALNVANNNQGSTLTLLADVELIGCHEIRRGFILDLNGKTLDLQHGIILQIAGTEPLTVRGAAQGSTLKLSGSGDSGKSLDFISGKLTLESGDVRFKDGCSLIVSSGGELLVSGANLYLGASRSNFIVQDNGTVTISGGSVTGGSGPIPGIDVNGNGSLTINGGAFKSNVNGNAFLIRSANAQRITITGGSFPGGLAVSGSSGECLKDLLGKNENGEIAYWYVKDVEASNASPITAEEAARSSLIANLTVLPHTSHQYGDNGLCYCGKQASVASIIKDNASNVSTSYFETLEAALAVVGNLNDEQRMTITIRDKLVISAESLTIPEKVNVNLEENASLTVGTLYLDGTIDPEAINKVHATTIYSRLRLIDCTLTSGEHIENQDGTYYIQSGDPFTLEPNLDDGEMFIRWILSDTAPNPVNNTFTMLPYPAVIGVEKAAIVATVTINGVTLPYPSLIAAFNAAYNREAVIELKKDDVLEQGKIIQITSKITLKGKGTITCKTPGVVDSTKFWVKGGEFILEGDGVTLDTNVTVRNGTCTVNGANLGFLDVSGGSATVIKGNVEVLSVTKNEEAGFNGTASLSGGTFKVIAANGMLLADLLEDGYAYYVEGNKTWVDANNGENDDYLTTATGSIIVKKVPVSFTTQPTATTTMTYGDTNTLTAVATSGTLAWYEGDTQVGTGSELNLRTFNAGEHSFCCKVTVDGYTAVSKTATVTIATRQLSIQWQNAAFTYNGKEQHPEVTIGNLVNGDSITLTFDGAQTNAGDNYTAKITGITAGNDTTQASNYCLPDSGLEKQFSIARAKLTVNVAIANKQYDGLNTASFDGTPTLVGLLEADKDKVQLTNGTPTFASEKVSEEPIAINFTDFSISGDASGNYALTQPTGITARIYNSFQANENVAFTSNSGAANENGWLNQDLVITAKDGYQLSTSNTAKGPWSDKLTVSNDGTDKLEFYVRNTETGAISQVVEKDYQIDKTQPNGVDITIGNQDASNKDAQLYLNDDVAVKITGKDATSGVAQVYHFLTTEELTDEQVEANTLWVPNANFKVEGADATSYRIYIKVVDKAGNVAYFQSSRFDFDKTDPKITGVDNGNTYYTTQTVKVEDTNLDKVTLTTKTTDGEETKDVTAPVQLTGDVDKETTYTIEATDKAGRSTTVTVTMKPLSTLTQDILSKDGEILNGDTVTKDDQSKLESAKEALDKLKGTGTEEEQDKISEMLESINGALTALDNVKALEDEINGIKTPVEPDDGDKEQQIIDAREHYENLTPHEKELVDKDVLKQLEALEKALVDYKFVGGNGSSWSMGSGVDFTLQANGPLKKLTGVKLDGVLLDASDYTATNNRTTITFDAAFMQNLSVDTHTIQLVYSDGESEVGSFEVKQSVNYLDLTGNPDFENQTKVFIDGVSYPIEEIGGKRYVNLPETGDLITTFTYSAGDEQDSYSNYPTSMTVHLINRAPDGTTVTNIPEFANLLQYSGCSIRITGNRGIRMITSISESKKQALLGSGLAGFKLVEYGTVVSWKEELGENELNLDTGKHNYALKYGVADPVFNQIGGLTQYTNVLVGFDLAECSKDIVMRPYITLQDADGNLHTLYGGCVTRSISYIAWQNQNTYAPGTPAYDYVHELMALYKAA